MFRQIGHVLAAASLGIAPGPALDTPREPDDFILTNEPVQSAPEHGIKCESGIHKCS
jgi:hypothetical protein